MSAWCNGTGCSRVAVSKMRGWTGSALLFPNFVVPLLPYFCGICIHTRIYLYILYLKLKHCIHKKTIWFFKREKLPKAHQKKIRDGDISVVSPGMSLEGWRRQCVRIAKSASRKRLGCVLTNATKKWGWGWGEAKSLLPRFLEGFKHQTFWGFTIYIWNKSETTTWDGAETL